MTALRLYARLAGSRANGPGLRAVVWVQGCTLACKGCFNPETHASGGEAVEVAELLHWLDGLDDVDGLTVSGGEPLQQALGVRDLLAGARARGLSTLVFSGYTLAEIEAMAHGSAILATLDVLVAGRYVPARHQGSALIGSANQQLHLMSPRHRLAEFADIAAAEVMIDAAGRVTVSGVDPPRLQ